MQFYALLIKRFHHFKRSKKGFLCEVRKSSFDSWYSVGLYQEIVFGCLSMLILLIDFVTFIGRDASAIYLDIHGVCQNRIALLRAQTYDLTPLAFNT